MFLRPGAKALLVALAFLAVTALPLVAADHAYSHRYIVYGRVVDAENDPVPGLTVDLGYEKPFEPEGTCANQPGTETEAFGPTRTTPVTNELGEFVFCFHTHAMSRTTPGMAKLRIESLDYEHNFEFDGNMRVSFIHLTLDAVHPAANKTVGSELYTVLGRAWRSSSTATSIESIRVYGDTAHNKPVNITLTYNGKDPMFVNTTTNNYGDFSIRFPVVERPTSGSVSIVIENETFTQSISPTGASSFRAELSTVKDPFVTKFLIGLGIFSVVVVGGGAIWFGSSRMKVARDERLAREQTSRKRSNK